MLNKVVTIDFDIIMEPSIECYNLNIEGENGDYDKQMENFPFLFMPPANLETYQKLTNILVLYTGPIFVTENHQDVYYYLKQNHIVNGKLINIDHHHDIEYNDSDIVNNSLGNIHCGNWVRHCIDDYFIGEYVWIRDINSVMPTPVVEKAYPNYKTILINNYNLQEILSADVIIVCKSPEWVPHYYWPLFEIWSKLINSKKYDMI